MSLLMDALKRAEARGGETPARELAPTVPAETIEQAASNSPLQLEPLEPAASAPAENGSDAPAAAPQAAPPATEHPETAAASPRQAQSALEALAVRRSSARRHLMFVTSGLLSAALILAAYYFWQVNAAVRYPVAPTATLIDTPAAAAPAEPAAQAAPEPPAAAGSTVPAANAQPVTPAFAQAAEDPPGKGATAGAGVQPAKPEAADYRVEIRRARQPARVPANLQQAYGAYRQGDYEQADLLYRQVLKAYPANRDAMLGLAAIAVHQGNRQLARHYYERLLRSDPSDKTALLALQGLSGGQYSLESGSKLKYWLQADPDNPQLHFALGNQYAASGQWKEAQQAYFEAHRLAPANADYAFNLAVSLDQLGLGKQALDYYRQARSLAGSGGGLFSAAQLEARIRQLQAAAEAAP